MTEHDERIHLVGIGGMHMSAIAQLLLADGVTVSGSDLSPSPLTQRLQTLGATVFAGHSAEHVGTATLVVTTAAAKPDNVELIEARSRGIPILARHEMVARLMAGRTGVAVAGTHGKTTTSSLVAYLLRGCGQDPTFLLGGESPDLGGNAAAGSGPHVVVEADEYAGAFLAYHPELAIITNIESDHLDYFGTPQGVVDAFGRFAANVAKAGVIIACADSVRVREVLRPPQATAATVRWYSVEDRADWTATAITLRVGGGSEFVIEHDGRPVATVHLLLPGRHNVANALASFAAGSALGLDPTAMATAIGRFHGVHRRFEVLGEAAGVTVVDDYAHHPSEIRATIHAARQRYPNKRLVVLFQPHTYSRTEYLLDAFRCCFDGVDALYLLQTFAARESADAGMDARALGEHLVAPPLGVAINLPEAQNMLSAAVGPGDVVFTMGAGDVTNVAPSLLAELRRR